MNSREEFFKVLLKIAEKDEKVIILTNDVGYSFTDEFAEKYPKQFINCGIIEQTIMGIAAGLALEGKRPYVYSMIPFVTMRNYEQLRNDVCYENLPVKIIGVKGSEHYKFLGPSHNITKDEDIKLLSHLPNLKIYTPEPKEVKKVVMESYTLKAPCYIRL